MSGADTTGRETVGFIGLGDMGAAMAANLAEQGWNPVVYARRAASLEPLAGLQHQVAESSADVANACDILCLCVVDAAQIHGILFGPDDAARALRPGAIVIVHSTISPSDCVRLAEAMRSRGIGVIDAPVSGSAVRGRAGTLTIGVGGSVENVARCLPLLETEGSEIVHLGQVGTGQKAKLYNNAIMLAQLALVHDAASASPLDGIDPHAMLRFVTTGTGASWAAGYYADALRSGKKVLATASRYPGGAVGIMRKDADIFAKECAAGRHDDGLLGALAARAIDSLRTMLPEGSLDELAAARPR